MTMAFRRMLVPTDFSDCSDAAGDVAGALARQLGAVVDVVTVIDTGPLFEGYGDPVYREQRIAAIRGEAEKKLDAFVARHFPGVSRVQAVIRDGDTLGEIVAMAGDVGSDVIVMGTHGRTGLPHLLIGSVAEKVVRHSPVPVLTVRPPGK
jgi:nucleotide-binding universal stress UspA family protein